MYISIYIHTMNKYMNIDKYTYVLKDICHITCCSNNWNMLLEHPRSNVMARSPPPKKRRPLLRRRREHGESCAASAFEAPGVRIRCSGRSDNMSHVFGQHVNIIMLASDPKQNIPM